MTQNIPLCIDLDDTLVRTDTLWEAMAGLVIRRPWQVPRVLASAIAGGRAGLKHSVAEASPLRPESLPLHAELVDYIREQRDLGRRIVLVTAAPQRVARAVADHVGLFHDVHASGETSNLKGRAKAELLNGLYGRRGYAYAGDCAADLPIWRDAAQAILVGAPRHLRARIPGDVSVLEIGTLRRCGLALVSALRLHQWAKNLLLFVALILAHRYDELPQLLRAFGAFVAFGLCASAGYLLNDLLDLESDRQHPEKRRRALASAELPIAVALLAIPALLCMGVALGFALSPAFGAIAAGYFVASSAYSLHLKRVPAVDVAVLASLYAVRIVAGAAVVQVRVSPWLVAFAIFAFLGLALAKRCAELRRVGDRPLHGRGYSARDATVLSQMGIASSWIAAMVACLYVQSADVQVLYDSPGLLWGVCAIFLFWQLRMWLLTDRGEVPSDPVLYAVKDPMSWACGLLATALVILAARGH